MYIPLYNVYNYNTLLYNLYTNMYMCITCTCMCIILYVQTDLFSYTDLKKLRNPYSLQFRRNFSTIARLHIPHHQGRESTCMYKYM